jgi:MFS transporter, AAHS family, 4-hydroxybenzoate transporter
MIASLIWAAFPLGGTAGGFLNAYILTRFGWPAIFLIGGVLPLIAAGALAIWLPESVRFLVAEHRDPEKARAIARRIVPALPPGAQIVADEEYIEGAALKHLFTEGRAVGTILLWVPFITAFGTLAITVVWTPTLLRANGIAPSQAAVVLGFHGLGALIGMGSAGRLIERFGAIATLVPALILGTIATGAAGFAATSVTSISIVLALIGVFVGMGASGAIALAALNYPTAMRSTGVGWAMGMGRGGQVIAPLLITLMLSWNWATPQIFVATAVAPLIAAVFILAFSLRAGSSKSVSAAPVGSSL